MFVYSMNKDINTKVSQGKLKLTEKYFVGEFMNWPLECYHPNLKLLEDVGSIGDIEIECKALLKEHDVYIQDFKAPCNEYLAT